jgi:DNA polymerase-4
VTVPSTLLYVEVPSFYAAVERAAAPDLRERPVIVGGSPRKRGRVQSATADALAAGVEVGMLVLDALERCPSARALRTDMKRYREAAGRLRAELRAEVERLEAAGLEAAFLDATGAERSAETIAAAIRTRLGERLGLPSQVGIASVKFLARIAAARAGSAGVLRVAAGEEARFLAPLPVSVLPGVGPKTLERLRELGAKRVCDLQALGRLELERALGNHGLHLLELSHGEDPQPVRAARAPRSLGQETTFVEPQRDVAAIGERLQRLARSLESTLRRQGLGARRVAVKVRYADHESATRTRTLDRPIGLAAEIAAVAEALLERTSIGERPVRTLGIRLAALGGGRAEDRQLDLFEAPVDAGEGEAAAEPAGTAPCAPPEAARSRGPGEPEGNAR